MTHSINTTSGNNKRLLIEFADNLKREEKNKEEQFCRVLRLSFFCPLVFFVGFITYVLITDSPHREQSELNTKRYTEEEGRSYGRHQEAARKYKMDYDPDYYMNK